MSTLRAPIAFALASCLCALPAHGVEKRVVERWSKELDTTSTLLKEGKHGAALPRLKKLTGEMVEVFGPGDQAAQAFGIVVVQRALAEAGLGHRDDALWYWHVALGIDPRFAKSDLSVFGEAGRFLKESPVPAPHPELVGPQSPFVEAPKIRKRVPPEYPEGAKAFGVEGNLVVEIVLGADGIPREPRVLQPLPAATLTYVTLEAMKRWQFEPARYQGEPVAVWYNLTVQYKLGKN